MLLGVLLEVLATVQAHSCEIDGRYSGDDACGALRGVLLEVLVFDHRPGFSLFGVYAGAIICVFVLLVWLVDCVSSSLNCY